MIRRIGEESMYLLVVDGVTDPQAVREKLGLQNLAL